MGHKHSRSAAKKKYQKKQSKKIQQWQRATKRSHRKGEGPVETKLIGPNY